MNVVAEVADPDIRIIVRAAPPMTLHDDYCGRTDGNSPVIAVEGGVAAFFAHYEPRGHTLRRIGDAGLRFRQPAVPVVILDDPHPGTGKWIEAVWRDPDGPLHGWYDAEEAALRRPQAVCAAYRRADLG
jgi:hypothetical protein